MERLTRVAARRALFGTENSVLGGSEVLRGIRTTGCAKAWQPILQPTFSQSALTLTVRMHARADTGVRAARFLTKAQQQSRPNCPDSRTPSSVGVRAMNDERKNRRR